MEFRMYSRTPAGLWVRHSENPWRTKSGMTQEELLREYGDHPVCPKCERPAWRDKGWAEERRGACNMCGWTGIATMTVRDYVERRMYQ